jgi:ketosteroid isomerase-like protein
VRGVGRAAGLSLVLVLAAARGAAVAETGPSSVTLPPELDRVLRDYETFWRARDASGLAKLFAEDGFVLSSSTPPVRGRAAIARHYAGSGGALSLRAFAYATDGRLGYILGGYAWDGAAPDTGKFTLTLVRGTNGRWLIFSDMDNGNARHRD